MWGRLAAALPSLTSVDFTGTSVTDAALEMFCPGESPRHRFNWGPMVMISMEVMRVPTMTTNGDCCWLCLR